jgi:hypothetical protein
MMCWQRCPSGMYKPEVNSNLCVETRLGKYTLKMRKRRSRIYLRRLVFYTCG